MTENIINFSKIDPFEEASGLNSNEKIHIRRQKRNGRKSITIIENLSGYLESESINVKSFLKQLKKKFSCNGSIKDGNILFSGDQVKQLTPILINDLKLDKENIIIHG